MILAAKVLAAVAGRTQITRDDVRRVALPALRHRITLSFEGHAQEAGIDGIVTDILRSVSLMQSSSFNREPNGDGAARPPVLRRRPLARG